MTTAASGSASVILVGGHESANGMDVRNLGDRVPSAVVSAAGRPLNNAASRLLMRGAESVVVVPITFGRDPSFVADTAKTLTWLARENPGRLALSESFGTLDHLAAWLRTAATVVRASAPEAAVVITADAANPFDDAELFRIAHLVRTHGAGNQVEVAIDDGHDGLATAIDRVRRLGFAEAVLVPAGFQREARAPLPSAEGMSVRFYGPLMSEDAAVRVVHQRIGDALHRLAHGDDGIEAGLMADHGHGYAHSHAFDAAANGHTHNHSHQTHQHHHDSYDDSLDQAHDRAPYAKGTHHAR
ncbi:hypothetical protein [Homoserinimonas hongtaonis]|uniref:Cobalamin biosynthesis protein CbiX n=1 Tax=Homoserinimonas hongtaonis TaxID=2079791 RepID=A0A2U1SY06_9MICO|nr:hypothetical protein [Salinibacterium hongtaonis]AWB88961.1 hypothetical protein C2138_04875 [Salinibacterium hongtaonis]PWB96423.1 hypothetical protein DF220_00120 [Salinibacterium hongtaonis]